MKATFSLACPAKTLQQKNWELLSAENLTARCFQIALDTSSQEVRVLEKAGDIVGFSLVDYKPDRLNIPLADGIPELKRCYVDSKHHGTGAAQLLLNCDAYWYFRCVSGSRWMIRMPAQ